LPEVSLRSDECEDATRNGNFSTLGYCKLDGPLSIVERKKEPIFFPMTPESFRERGGAKKSS
jgi:hypothetical protein